MPSRLEITLKPEMPDAEGEGIRKKAEDYFGIRLQKVRVVHILTIDAELSAEQLKTIQTDIFTNPVTQISSYDPLPMAFDWIIWVGYRPGVRDNPGSTAIEAIRDVLGVSLGENEAVYTSRRYCIQCKGLSPEEADKIAGELLANDLIQQRKIALRLLCVQRINHLQARLFSVVETIAERR